MMIMPPEDSETALTIRVMQDAIADWKKDVDRRFDDVVVRLERMVTEFQTFSQEQGVKVTSLEHRVSEVEKDVADLYDKRRRDRVESREDRRASNAARVAIGTAIITAIVSIVLGVLNLTIGG